MLNVQTIGLSKQPNNTLNVMAATCSKKAVKNFEAVDKLVWNIPRVKREPVEAMIGYQRSFFELLIQSQAKMG